MTKKRAIVMASGRGSNFQALADACKNNSLPLQIEGLITNNSRARAIDVAKSFSIPFHIFENHKDLSHDEHEKPILMVLDKYKPDYILLCGYMRILSKEFIKKFTNTKIGLSNIINIHPSMLPNFPGENAYKKAFDSKAKSTGVTVHFVDEGIDSGSIIYQEAFDISDCKTSEQVEERGLQIEHRVYTFALKKILSSKSYSKNKGDRYVQFT